MRWTIGLDRSRVLYTTERDGGVVGRKETSEFHLSWKRGGQEGRKRVEGEGRGDCRHGPWERVDTGPGHGHGHGMEMEMEMEIGMVEMMETDFPSTTTGDLNGCSNFVPPPPHTTFHTHMPFHPL